MHDFAARFDDAPDHGLTDPAIRNAWRGLLDGLRPEDIEAALPHGLVASPARNLSANPLLWGKPVSDNRYLLVATRA